MTEPEPEVHEYDWGDADGNKYSLTVAGCRPYGVRLRGRFYSFYYDVPVADAAPARPDVREAER